MAGLDVTVTEDEWKKSSAEGLNALIAARLEARRANPPAGLDFGEALQALKSGSKVARSGWNGNGMFVVHQKAYPDGIGINKNTAEALGLPEGTQARFLPYLMMKTVDGSFVPWLASQTDVLAEDWTIAK